MKRGLLCVTGAPSCPRCSQVDPMQRRWGLLRQGAENNDAVAQQPFILPCCAMLSVMLRALVSAMQAIWSKVAISQGMRLLSCSSSESHPGSPVFNTCTCHVPQPSRAPFRCLCLAAAASMTRHQHLLSAGGRLRC